MHEVRAHSGEVTDIALHEINELCVIATSGRDRTVQLFGKRNDSLQLIQTTQEHSGAVGQLLFANEGARLLSSSSDRTVEIMQRVTREEDGITHVIFLHLQKITLRSSPVSMSLSPDDPDTVIVSTLDRCISQFDFLSARQIHAFRPADPESNETVVMGSLTATPARSGKNPKLLIGVSSTDKSVRLYDMEKGALLTGEFGHTEGVSDVRLLEKHSHPSSESPEKILISSGIDGVVMIWKISVQLQQPQEYTQPAQASSGEEEEAASQETVLSKPPLRKVLSKQDLVGFKRPDNLALTPTPIRDMPQQSPPLLRRMSRASVVPPARSTNMIPTTPTSAPPRHSPTSSKRPDRLRNSPSPPSPKSTGAKKTMESRSRNNNRCSSLDFRSRNRASGKSDFGSLNMSTEQVCRTLRAYRKKLNGSTEPLHSQKELERELSLTLRGLNSRARRVETKRGETETDSSGKENERLPAPPPIPSNDRRVPRRIPSTPNLGQKKPPKPTRRRSLGPA